MNENLVGYLLDALDPEEKREVERCLREQPDAGTQLELLRKALEPLALDRDMVEPPAGLCERTLARAEAQRTPAVVGASSRSAALRLLRVEPTARSNWWRRSDVLVAACLILCVTILIPPGLTYLRYRADIATCQNNLHDFYQALSGYSDRHQGVFPDVTAVKAPDKVAGLVVPVLRDEMGGGSGYRELTVTCPGPGEPSFRRLRGPSMRDLQNMDPREFERYATELLGNYSYSLGYRDADNVYRMHRNGQAGPMPIMGDRPPLHVFAGDRSNSPNHWGKGQNVLYSDGTVRFVTNRNVGVNLDDIYTNVNGEVAAGRHPSDAVLGESKAKP